MSKQMRALRVAFPHTIPVLTGFMFLGIAYGILMNSKGYGVGLTALMSLLAFAGSAQYVAIPLLSAAFNPVYVLLLTLLVNARHLFYGLSMLDRFKTAGRFKPYLIFGLCDETFSIIFAATPPPDVDRTWFMFFITLLNHAYWVLGSVIGALLGAMVSFNTRGLDFVLTALFVVIFVEQWKSQTDHRPAIVGVTVTAACLAILGKTNFIIPAMVLMLLALTLMRKKNAGTETDSDSGSAATEVAE